MDKKTRQNGMRNGGKKSLGKVEEAGWGRREREGVNIPRDVEGGLVTECERRGGDGGGGGGESLQSLSHRIGKGTVL